MDKVAISKNITNSENKTIKKNIDLSLFFRFKKG
jgi:hypothetical protein